MYEREIRGCLGPIGWGIVIVALVGMWLLYYVFDASIDFSVGMAVVYVVLAIFWSAVFFPFVVAGLGLGLGLLWAPFGALICARMARSRGLNRRRYAAAGAVYSVLFFWPWVYLVARMANRAVPAYLVRGAYATVYFLIWPLAALSLCFPAMGASVLRPLLLLLLPCAVTWFISLKNLLGLNKYEWRTDDDDSEGIIPERVYIMPLAYAFVWTLFAGAAWAATYFVEPDSLSYSL